MFFPAQLLHRGGPFINSLLHLEELGFRSSSLTIKKIAFIAWKSLIDNFALNPGESRPSGPSFYFLPLWVWALISHVSLLQTSCAAPNVWSSWCSRSPPSTWGRRSCCSPRWRSGGTWWCSWGPTCHPTLIRSVMTPLFSLNTSSICLIWCTNLCCLCLSRFLFLCSSAPSDPTPLQSRAPLQELSVKMVLLPLAHPRLVRLHEECRCQNSAERDSTCFL